MTSSSSGTVPFTKGSEGGGSSCSGCLTIPIILSIMVILSPFLFIQREIEKGQRQNEIIHRIENGYMNMDKMISLSKELIREDSSERFKNPVKIIEELLNAGVKIKDSDDIVYPIERGDIEMVNLLVNSGLSIENYCNTQFYTNPLSYAIYNEDIKMVKYLLSLGATVNWECILEYDDQPNEPNALFSAIETGNLKIIKQVVKAGVNINFRNYDDKTPLDIVKERNGEIEVIKFLISSGAE